MIKWYSRHSYCTASASYKPAGCLKNAASIKKKSGVKGKCHPAFQKGSVLKWPQTAQFQSLLFDSCSLFFVLLLTRKGGAEWGEGRRLEFLAVFTSWGSDTRFSPWWQPQGNAARGLAAVSGNCYTNIILGGVFFFFGLRSLLSYFIYLSW